MKRGEVWWINFDPSVGEETQKTRPALIVSNDASNRHLNRLQVVPLTSNAQNEYAGEARVTLNDQMRKAQANLLTTISKERVLDKLGVLGESDLARVVQAIKVQLQLS